jgi:C2H2-type zinc finger/Zinc finger, C2H2 type
MFSRLKNDLRRVDHIAAAGSFFPELLLNFHRTVYYSFLFQVHHTEDFPKYFCQDCASQLDQFRAFKEICLQSAQIFQNSMTIKVEAFDESSTGTVGDQALKSEIEDSVEEEDDVDVKPVAKRRRRSSEKTPSGSSVTVCPEAGCSKQFRSMKRFEKHCATHRAPSPNESEANVKPAVARKHKLEFVCSFEGCKRAFIDTVTRDAHVASHENGGVICCPICSRTFTDYRALRRHVPIHENRESRKEMHKCSICQRGFVSERCLAEHTLAHKGEQHICEECGRVFSTPGRLRSHKLTHASAVPEVCQLCGQSFATKSQLHGHNFEAHRPKDTMKIPCVVCGAMYKKKTMRSHCLAAHTVYTTTENVFGCPLCPIKYKNEKQVKQHIRLSHNNERNHACPECPLKFGTPNRLKRHSYTHTGERPFKCELCEKGFSEKYKLQEHIMRGHLNQSGNVGRHRKVNLTVFN